MFAHNKRLQYTVRVEECNPGLANLLLEQFGGPQGELAAAMRYFTQHLAEEDPGRKDMLIDIATEELSHLEIIGNIVAMLNRGAKGRLAEGVDSEADMYRMISGSGNDSHVTQILYGGGPALTNSGGVPWTAAYVDSIGDPTCDLRSNIAAESRAKIVYERLISCTDDPGVKDALGFLMTREIAHQQSFEKALYSIQRNFPPGKLSGMPDFTNAYFNMSVGDGDARGPWNNEPAFDFREAKTAVDGGTGMASVSMGKQEEAAVAAMAGRLQSSAAADPLTGAMLGLDGGTPADATAIEPQAARLNAEAMHGGQSPGNGAGSKAGGSKAVDTDSTQSATGTASRAPKSTRSSAKRTG